MAGTSETGLALTAIRMAMISPQGATRVDRHAINLLRCGSTGRITFTKAARAPIRKPVDLRRARDRDRFKVIDRDPVLTSLTRADARMVRDKLQDRVKKTGRDVGGKVSPKTVERELSIIAAVIAFGVREFDLPDSLAMPVKSLPMAGGERGASESASEKRLPFPAPNLAKTAPVSVGAATRPSR